MSSETPFEANMPVETEIPVTPRDDIHPVSRAFLFLEDAKVKRNFIWLPLAGLIICSILGVFHPQKHPLPYEAYIPGSWAIFGFLVFALIAVSASTLFRFLGRSESYYGEGGLPDPDVGIDPVLTGEIRHD